MCDRHELPHLIEHDVPGIVSKRVKRKDVTLSQDDPLNLDTETEAIFKGLRNALLIILVVVLLFWSLPNTYQFFKTTAPMLALGSWSHL